MAFICQTDEDKKRATLDAIADIVKELQIEYASELANHPPCCCCAVQQEPDMPYEPPNAMICCKIGKAKNIGAAKGKTQRRSNEVPEVIRLKQSKSRELRAGIMYIGCDCEKRNGLQDDCQRTECHGSPECLTQPYPTCGPSEFCNGKHLGKQYPPIGTNTILGASYGAPNTISGGTYGITMPGTKNDNDAFECEYQCFPIEGVDSPCICDENSYFRTGRISQSPCMAQCLSAMPRTQKMISTQCSILPVCDCCNPQNNLRPRIISRPHRSGRNCSRPSCNQQRTPPQLPCRPGKARKPPCRPEPKFPSRPINVCPKPLPPCAPESKPSPLPQPPCSPSDTSPELSVDSCTPLEVHPMPLPPCPPEFPINPCPSPEIRPPSDGCPVVPPPCSPEDTIAISPCPPGPNLQPPSCPCPPKDTTPVLPCRPRSNPQLPSWPYPPEFPVDPCPSPRITPPCDKYPIPPLACPPGDITPILPWPPGPNIQPPWWPCTPEFSVDPCPSLGIRPPSDKCLVPPPCCPPEDIAPILPCPPRPQPQPPWWPYSPEFPVHPRPSPRIRPPSVYPVSPPDKITPELPYPPRPNPQPPWWPCPPRDVPEPCLPRHMCPPHGCINDRPQFPCPPGFPPLWPSAQRPDDSNCIPVPPPGSCIQCLPQRLCSECCMRSRLIKPPASPLPYEPEVNAPRESSYALCQPCLPENSVLPPDDIEGSYYESTCTRCRPEIVSFPPYEMRPWEPPCIGDIKLCPPTRVPVPPIGSKVCLCEYDLKRLPVPPHPLKVIPCIPECDRQHTSAEICPAGIYQVPQNYWESQCEFPPANYN